MYITGSKKSPGRGHCSVQENEYNNSKKLKSIFFNFENSKKKLLKTYV